MVWTCSGFGLVPNSTHLVLFWLNTSLLLETLLRHNQPIQMYTGILQDFGARSYQFFSPVKFLPWDIAWYMFIVNKSYSAGIFFSFTRMPDYEAREAKGKFIHYKMLAMDNTNRKDFPFRQHWRKVGLI